jgi:hypothetical protein
MAECWLFSCIDRRSDDYVGEDNPVRIVDAFIDELDLAVLGFAVLYRKRSAVPRTIQ